MRLVEVVVVPLHLVVNVVLHVHQIVNCRLLVLIQRFRRSYSCYRLHRCFLKLPYTYFSYSFHLSLRILSHIALLGFATPYGST